MAAPDLTPGGSLGHFRIIEKIGAGGFGIVYRARDERLGRDVAIKVLNARTLSEDSARRQFQREALTLSQLDHPNLQSVFEFNSENGIDYLVLGYISGASLDELVKKGPLPEKEVLSLGIQLVRGLAAAHAKGVLHRDLKPGNLRVTPENVLKILDFGLAQRFASPEAATLEEGMTITLDAPGTVAGTPAYMAPEQLDGHPEHRSDIYSVGVVLYEMATGTRPFPQREQQLLSDAIRYSTPPAPRTKNKEISPALEAVILKCLQKDPNLRYQSANELLDDLKELARGSSSHRAVTGVPSPRPHRWFLVGMILIAVLTVGILNRNKVLKWVGVLPAEPSMKHVAVLPFHMTGAQPQETVLFEGLTDTVTNRLMQLTASQPVGIIPFSEIIAHHVTDMQEARAKLGANLALDGNVQRSGDQLQVNLALADIESHKILRADSVTGAAADFKQFEERVVDAAVSMLELELHKNPPPDEAHGTTSSEAYEAFMRGKGYLARSSTPENADSAVAEFTRALQLDPGYAVAHALLGRAYWVKYKLTKDKQYMTKMRTSCEHSLKQSPLSAEGNICLGMFDAGIGDYQKAASEFQLAIDSDPTNDLAYRRLAAVYQSLGRMEQAEKTYQKAIRTHPQDPSDIAALGTFYDSQARYDEAAAQFERAVSLAPDVAEYRSELGGTYLFAGVYPKAEEALRSAIKLQPSYEAYSNLGQTYFLERKGPDAIEAFEQATIRGGHQIQAHGNLGRAYYWYSPEHAKAKAELRKAIDLADSALQVNPNDADAHTLVAEYYAMLGEKVQALQHLQAALDLRPGDGETQYYAAKVYNLLKNREEALNWLEKSVKSGYSAAEINNTIEFDSLRGDPRFQAIGQKLHS